MVEQKENSNDFSTEQYASRILEYFNDTEFGSAKHQAFYDFRDHGEAIDCLIDVINSFKEFPENRDEGKIIKESDLRKAEIHLTMIERDIERKRTTLPGYEAEYLAVQGMFEDLGFIISEGEGEIHKKDRIYKNFVNEVHTYLFERFNIKETK